MLQYKPQLGLQSQFGKKVICPMPYIIVRETEHGTLVEGLLFKEYAALAATCQVLYNSFLVIFFIDKRIQ